MPTSQPRTLTPVFSIIQKMNIQSVLDIGVGHGKTGLLLREYLDIMNMRYKPEEWRTKIYGIEAFENYRNDLWEYAYDRVVIADALDGIREFPDIDLIVALDIWEHFEPSYEAKIRQTCLEKARWVLISTPKEPASQEDVFSNSYERHVSKWSPNDFRQVPYRLITCTRDDWIILLSSREPFPSSIRYFSYPTYHLFEGLGVAIALWKQKIRF